MKDFFLSYNKSDRLWAEWIAWQLEEAGYSTLIQAWDFGAGSNFGLEMHRAVDETQHTIAVLSPTFLESEFTAPEWVAAFVQDPSSKQRKLLPVRVRKCEPPGLLRAIVYADLVGKDEAEAKQELFKGVKSVLGERLKPTTSVPFPTAATLHKAPPRFPSGLPPIWNVPSLRNPHFTGRDELLAQVRQTLTAAQTAAPTQAALYGLGGAGKTQLAVEYAYRHAADYDVIWWVRAEEDVTVSSDLAGLAEAFVLPVKDFNELPVVTEAVRRTLGQRQRWLLIFDNAPTAQAIRPYLPQSSSGHVLITSRDVNWGSAVPAFKVEMLPVEQGAKFLLERTAQTDLKSARALSITLGGLPLALEQAGAYIEATGKPLSDYLKLFRQRQPEMVGRGGQTAENTQTVATTWELSFQQVQETSPAAAELLNLCAFLAPEAIPLSLILDQAALLPPALAQAAADELLFDDALAALRRVSLIEVDAKARAFSLHRLVQTVVRRRLSDEQQKQYATIAVSLVSAAFPEHGEDASVWPSCAALVPHALNAINHLEKFDTATADGASLTCTVGRYFFGRADFSFAKELFERALQKDEAIFGAVHPNVARDVHDLGVTLETLGKFAEARRYYERALQLKEVAYGTEHPEFALTMGCLGDSHLVIGEFGEARRYYERALQIREAVLGLEHPDVATSICDLGSVHAALGEYGEARRSYERALQIREAVYGLEHPAVATSVGSLGDIHKALGEFGKARCCYERALQIREAVYGLDHPAVATSMNDLGNIHQELGEHSEARCCYERALRIREAVYGLEHPSVATSVGNLGVALESLGRHDEARRCYERALQIQEVVFGVDHPDVALTVNNLGVALQALGEYVQARLCHERSLQIREATFGKEHPAVAESTNNLGGLLLLQKNYAKARIFLERAIKIQEKLFGEEHPNIGKTHANLGSVMLGLRQPREARKHWRRAWQIFRKYFGDEHHDTQEALKGLKTLGGP